GGVALGLLVGLAAPRGERLAVRVQGGPRDGELVARGGFGSPTMFINGSDMYFGNDRLPLVEAALTRALQAES
ncbi:MAG: hypothetical protein VXV74_05275, partial [Pseudomonadota bacterium]|nr:hypothetical protein [Pseudomonadota bacterium]